MGYHDTILAWRDFGLTVPGGLRVLVAYAVVVLLLAFSWAVVRLGFRR